MFDLCSFCTSLAFADASKVLEKVDIGGWVTLHSHAKYVSPKTIASKKGKQQVHMKALLKPMTVLKSKSIIAWFPWSRLTSSAYATNRKKVAIACKSVASV